MVSILNKIFLFSYHFHYYFVIIYIIYYHNYYYYYYYEIPQLSDDPCIYFIKSQYPPTAQRLNTFLRMYAVPNKVDIWVHPGISNLPMGTPATSQSIIIMITIIFVIVVKDSFCFSELKARFLPLPCQLSDCGN